jgi:hypothetical protein
MSNDDSSLKLDVICLLTERMLLEPELDETEYDPFQGDGREVTVEGTGLSGEKN